MKRCNQDICQLKGVIVDRDWRATHNNLSKFEWYAFPSPSTTRKMELITSLDQPFSHFPPEKNYENLGHGEKNRVNYQQVLLIDPAEKAMLQEARCPHVSPEVSRVIELSCFPTLKNTRLL